MEFKLTIILISVIIAMMDLVLAKYSFAQNRKEGRRLGWACLLGGDEFSAALFFDYDVPEEIMYNRAGEIFEKLQTAFHELTPRVSLSVGAAVSDSGSTFNDLYKNADEALYEAKNNGRDRIGFRQ